MKKKKVLLPFLILGILAILLSILLLFSKLFSVDREEVAFPVGSLSSDFFESQNTVYQKDAEFSTPLFLQYAPYSIDTPDVVSGCIGDGRAYHVSNDQILYISEMEEEETFESHMLLEYPKAELLDASPSLCRALEKENTSGYYNGFYCDYHAGYLTVSDRKTKVEVAYVAYVLSIPEYQEKLILMLTLKNPNTETLLECDAYLRRFMHTISYQESAIESILLRNPPDIEVSSEEVLEEEVEIEGCLPLSEVENEEESKLPDVPINTIVEIEEIEITKDYLDLILTCSWENPDTMIEARLYKDGMKFSPSRYEKGKAIFELGTFKKGFYQLEIKGYDYGETTITLEEGEDIEKE